MSTASTAKTTGTTNAALTRARKKAFRRLLPLVFLCYVIAYIDRANVSLAKLMMTADLRGFDDAVFGLGFGVFFIGYFLLEIPGTLLVEKWSARKWISRIMITWGLLAAGTAFVKTPVQFYIVRFFLGLAEAGFFPGIIVYLTHWFPSRDRARALATFLIATPVAQIISPKISNIFLGLGAADPSNVMAIPHAQPGGLYGWQWMYIFWGIPAVVLGVIVFFMLTDHPRAAKWLTQQERDALEDALAEEKAAGVKRHKRMSVLEALKHPKVLLLALAYFMTVSANYGIEAFLPSILMKWYSLKLSAVTWLVILPPCVALAGQLFMGWHSDRQGERRLHAVIPIVIGAIALLLASQSEGRLALTVACFMLAFGGIKSYQPAFWSLPNLFLTEAAAAGSIGLINSIGNLGGFLGPYTVGQLKSSTGSFVGGITVLASSMIGSALIIFLLGLGNREKLKKTKA
jgi:ACS family tartrate transporter-like MFS transporter